MKKILFLMMAVTSMGCGMSAAEVTKAPQMTQWMMNVTPEQRQSMAELHEKMAVCLRSGKPMSACRDEIQKNCHGMVGTESCYMMGMGKMHRGGMMGDYYEDGPKVKEKMGEKAE